VTAMAGTAVRLTAVRDGAPARPGNAGQFPHVLAGTVLDGPAAALAAMLDPAFLTEAGWDPATQVLTLPAEHRLLGRTVCRVGGCVTNARPGHDLCHHCVSRLTGQGLILEQIDSMPHLPPLPDQSTRCAVSGCECMTPTRRAVLCTLHSRQRRRMAPMPMGQFLVHPTVRALPPCGPCLVVACVRMADGGHGGYCAAHYQRWLAARTDPDLNLRRWRRTEPAVAEGGQVSLRGLAPLVVTEVLFALWRRTGNGAKVSDTNLRAACDVLRRQQVATLTKCQTAGLPNRPVRSLLAALAGHVRRGLADPAAEQAKDVWDLAVFGHRGNLSFTGIAQPWLRQAAKRWARDELPRHRGGGASKVREKINSVGLLSESLRCRPDHGQLPAALGRSDIVDFLNRLAYLESTATVSRYRRIVICRDLRAVLGGIRALGLTRRGQAAAGLADDVAIGRGDIPAEPEPGEPGRDLPPQIMAVLCANLDTLQPAEVRTAVQIGIDTGRRPEDILDLPLDCLTRDKDGAAVLVYDNAKANRLGRRLPISEATAAVIIAQQNRVRARFPDAPAGQLRLLPAPRGNPDGSKAISIDMLCGRHREWVDSLDGLSTADGGPFDTSKIILYAYRHTYAQRHADAGVPIDVLAQLLDHRNLNITRRYYRIGADRRRDAVDKVTAMSFDRHGNRIWRDAQVLLESEHARYAVGQVAVPFGTCTEPSNVAAGGGACPIRYRCAGCDHFRADISHLPELAAYLDDLLRTRERLAAAIDGVDDWARRDATPTTQEITRIRQLINRIKGDLAQLSEVERTQIDDAVAVVRRHRAAHTVNLGMPAIRATTPAPQATTASEAIA
jgi:integrase